jgi:hypothetical protein
VAQPDEAPAEPAGAPLSISGFRYRRAVREARAGLNALALDAAVLAHSRGLADVRLADPQGRQVPYLLEKRDEPLVVDLELEALDTEGDREPGSAARLSRYRLVLPHAGLPASRLVLTTRARVFERRVEVAAGDAERGRDERGDRPLAAAGWRHADPETPAPALTLELPVVAGDELVLSIDEGDNSPLPLGAPKLLLPAWRLRFFGTGGEVSLVYGRPGLAAARYDLALLAPRLVGAAAHEVEAGPEGDTGAGGERRQALVFWGALVAAVAALLVLLARLLGRSTGPPAP